MEMTTEMKWKLDLTAAVNAGVEMMAKQKQHEQEDKAQRAKELAQMWAVYDAEVRAVLPEVVRPLMVPLRDETCEPSFVYYEDALLDGERYGLAPIVAKMSAVTAGVWAVKEYVVLGIYECSVGRMKRYGFGDGDEFWAVEPTVVDDLRLALGLAHERFLKKKELDTAAGAYRPAEIEYVEDTQEEYTAAIAEKALAASVRAIVRDELKVA